MQRLRNSFAILSFAQVESFYFAGATTAQLLCNTVFHSSSLSQSSSPVLRHFIGSATTVQHPLSLCFRNSCFPRRTLSRKPPSCILVPLRRKPLLQVPRLPSAEVSATSFSPDHLQRPPIPPFSCPFPLPSPAPIPGFQHIPCKRYL